MEERQGLVKKCSEQTAFNRVPPRRDSLPTSCSAAESLKVSTPRGSRTLEPQPNRRERGRMVRGWTAHSI